MLRALPGAAMLIRASATRFLLGLTFLPAGCPAQQLPTSAGANCTVSRISDGDSFRCSDGRRVRLIGIDSPESQQRVAGARARSALLQLMPVGSTVRLETDVASTDRYGRQLAYAWVGSTLVNEAMVRDGWAMLYTVPPNVKYANRLERAQNEARTRGSGLWGERGFECPPGEFRQSRCVTRP